MITDIFIEIAIWLLGLVNSVVPSAVDPESGYALPAIIYESVEVLFSLIGGLVDVPIIGGVALFLRQAIVIISALLVYESFRFAYNALPITGTLPSILWKG